MQYRPDRYGTPISLLGFGCMRFEQTLGKIDIEKAKKLVQRAVEAGVNYFDTAYVYPGSEAALGEILQSTGLRDKVYIATKLPHYLVHQPQTMEKLFQEELRRLKTDHIDYYLMHMLTDVATWERLKALGIEDWLREKKESGAIRQVGFSYHGNSETFCRLVDAYPWEFCQIQYNYMDEHSQAGRRGLDYAHEKGLPVIIMEPLRGGKLVTHLPERAKKVFAACEKQYTPAQWAFRWLFDQEKITCVLSGMNTMDMLEDNIMTACSTLPGSMTEEEQAMLRQAADAINADMKVGCTGCGYCMPCPQNVDIPGTFSAYNRRFSEGKFSALKDHVMCTALRTTSAAASNCIGCGKCEAHCPQNIPIRAMLKEAAKELEGTPYRVAKWAVRLFRTY